MSSIFYEHYRHKTFVHVNAHYCFLNTIEQEILLSRGKNAPRDTSNRIILDLKYTPPLPDGRLLPFSIRVKPRVLCPEL